jgi:putative hydrolase of the HAD superfamily
MLPARSEVVFLDAAGTLFRVRGSVGEIYGSIAQRYGVIADSSRTELEFRQAFRSRSLAPLPAVAPGDTEAAEKRWWSDVVADVFGARMPGAVLRNYFDEVFEFFRGSGAWELFPDTGPALEWLRTRGYRLGVLSNFDSRLYPLLRSLGVAGYFESVTISWQAGAAKPDSRIFRAALERMKVAPARALHVGDSRTEDYEGALSAGLRAVLVDRDGGASHAERVVRDLTELCRLDDL